MGMGRKGVNPVKHPESAALLQVPAEPDLGGGVLPDPHAAGSAGCPLGKQCFTHAHCKHRPLGILPTATGMALQALHWQLLPHCASLGLPRCPCASCWQEP